MQAAGNELWRERSSGCRRRRNKRVDWRTCPEGRRAARARRKGRERGKKTAVRTKEKGQRGRKSGTAQGVRRNKQGGQGVGERGGGGDGLRRAINHNATPNPLERQANAREGAVSNRWAHGATSIAQEEPRRTSTGQEAVGKRVTAGMQQGPPEGAGEQRRAEAMGLCAAEQESKLREAVRRKVASRRVASASRPRLPPRRPVSVLHSPALQAPSPLPSRRRPPRLPRARPDSSGSVQALEAQVVPRLAHRHILGDVKVVHIVGKRRDCQRKRDVCAREERRWGRGGARGGEGAHGEPSRRQGLVSLGEGSHAARRQRAGHRARVPASGVPVHTVIFEAVVQPFRVHNVHDVRIREQKAVESAGHVGRRCRRRSRGKRAGGSKVGSRVDRVAGSARVDANARRASREQRPKIRKRVWIALESL